MEGVVFANVRRGHEKLWGVNVLMEAFFPVFRGGMFTGEFHCGMREDLLRGEQ